MAGRQERKKRPVLRGWALCHPRVSLPDPRPSSRLCPPFLEVKQRNLEAYSQVTGEERCTGGGVGWKGVGSPEGRSQAARLELRLGTQHSGLEPLQGGAEKEANVREKGTPRKGKIPLGR